MMAFAVIVIAVMLTSCGSRKATPPLNVLDQFWKTLGSGKNSTGVE